MFVYPNDGTTMFVKRIIGLPGDTIRIETTRVTVNGIDLAREELHDLGAPSLNRLIEDHVAFRESGDGISYRVLWRKQGEHASLALTVPNGQLRLLPQRTGL